MNLRNLAIGTALLSASATATAAAQPMNVLLFMTEDLGPHLSIYGDNTIYTPQIDNFASDATVFTNAYAAAPTCSPSRAALFTGTYPHENGHYLLAQPNGGSLNPNTVNFVSVLNDANYYTGLNYKIHVDPESTIPFHEFYSVIPTSEDTRAQFESFLGNIPDNKPFFYMAQSVQPHQPYSLPWWPELPPPYTEKDAEDSLSLPDFGDDIFLTEDLKTEVAGYYTDIQRADEIFGEILDVLRTKNLLDNTLVIFTSDHGPHFGRGKMSVNELGIRIPFVARHPKINAQRGEINNSLISLIDIFPTVLSAAGLQVPQFARGESIIKHIDDVESPDDLSREYLFSEYIAHDSLNSYWPTRSVRGNRYKLIHNLLDTSLHPENPISRHSRKDIIASANSRSGPRSKAIYELFRYPTQFQLYDLLLDPHETVNLIDDQNYTHIIEKLKAELLNWQLETNDPFVSPAFLNDYTDAYLTHEQQILQLPNPWSPEVDRKFPQEDFQFDYTTLTGNSFGEYIDVDRTVEPELLTVSSADTSTIIYGNYGWLGGSESLKWTINRFGEYTGTRLAFTVHGRKGGTAPRIMHPQILINGTPLLAQRYNAYWSVDTKVPMGTIIIPAGTVEVELRAIPGGEFSASGIELSSYDNQYCHANIDFHSSNTQSSDGRLWSDASGNSYLHLGNNQSAEWSSVHASNTFKLNGNIQSRLAAGKLYNFSIVAIESTTLKSYLLAEYTELSDGNLQQELTFQSILPAGNYRIVLKSNSNGEISLSNLRLKSDCIPRTEQDLRTQDNTGTSSGTTWYANSESYGRHLAFLNTGEEIQWKTASNGKREYYGIFRTSPGYLASGNLKTPVENIPFNVIGNGNLSKQQIGVSTDDLSLNALINNVTLNTSSDSYFTIDRVQSYPLATNHLTYWNSRNYRRQQELYAMPNDRLEAPILQDSIEWVIDYTDHDDYDTETIESQAFAKLTLPQGSVGTLTLTIASKTLSQSVIGSGKPQLVDLGAVSIVEGIVDAGITFSAASIDGFSYLQFVPN